jgi:hypothetical protein
MAAVDYSGHWIGNMLGTNSGGFAFDIRQQGEKLEGEAKLHEPALGQYEYKFTAELSSRRPARAQLVCGVSIGWKKVGS